MQNESRHTRSELQTAAFRFSELQIRTRIQREGRPGVVPSRGAGEAFFDVLTGDARSQLPHFPV